MFRFVLCLLLCCGLCGCHNAATPPPFDVPALLEKPIQVVSAQLGAPTTQAPNQKSWTRDGATLTIQFKPNGRVTSLALVSRAADRAVRDGEQPKLLEPGQLPAETPGYEMQWIEASERPLFYTGVKIVPAPRTHSVELRLSGSPVLVEASYALGGPQPKSETFLTIAPWNLTATLPDDATVNFNARLFKKLAPGKVEMKIEITVDGKVVASQSSSGTDLRCEFEI